MKYLKCFQEKKVFTSNYVVQLVGCENTAKSILYDYKKKKYIDSVHRGLYVALDLVTGNPIANRYEIGSSINEDAYISFHSALEYYGLSNQVFNTVTVSTKQRFNAFDYDYVSYERTNINIQSGIITPLRTPLVRVTDVERTIVDCFHDIDRAGGLDELMEALHLVFSVDEQKLFSYLSEYNQIVLWQKIGYIMSLLKVKIGISNDFLSLCKSKIHDKKQYLVWNTELKYEPDWKLYVPRNMDSLIFDGEIVNV